MAPEAFRSEESGLMEQHRSSSSKHHREYIHADEHQHQSRHHGSKHNHHHHHHHHDQINGIISHHHSNKSPTGGLIAREEEWTTSKRIVNHKTRQVETRVQRQLVMEDGKVIADSGPQVITRIKEDNHTEESEQDKNPASSGKKNNGPPEGYVEVKGPHGRVLGEKKQIQRVSREVREENMQYHDERIKELTGPEVHRRALSSPNELITIQGGGRGSRSSRDKHRRHGGSRSPSYSSSSASDSDDRRVAKDQANNPSQLFSRPPRGKMVHYSAKSKKLQDSDEVHEISKLAIDGSVTKEVKRTKHHEEFSDDEHPDDGHSEHHELPAAMKQTRRHFEYLNDFSSSDNSSSEDEDEHIEKSGRSSSGSHHHKHGHHSHHQKQVVPKAHTSTSTSHEGHVKHHKTRKEKAFPRYSIEPLIDHSSSAAHDNDYRRDSSTKWIKHTFEKTDRDHHHDYDDRHHRHHSPISHMPVPAEYKVPRGSSSTMAPATTSSSHRRRQREPHSPEPARSHSPTKSHLSHASHRTATSHRSLPKEDASVQATLTDEEENVERRSIVSQSSSSEHSHHKSTMSLKQQSTPKSQRNYYFGEPEPTSQEEYEQHKKYDDRHYRTAPSPSPTRRPVSRPSSRLSAGSHPVKSPTSSDHQIYSLSQRNKKHHTHLIDDNDAPPSPTPTTSGGSIKNVKTTTTTMSATLDRDSPNSGKKEASKSKVDSKKITSKSPDQTTATGAKKKIGSGGGKENDSSKHSVLFSPTTTKTEYEQNEAIAARRSKSPEQNKLREEVLNLKQKMSDITSGQSSASYRPKSSSSQRVIDIEALPVADARREIRRHQQQFEQQVGSSPSGSTIYHRRPTPAPTGSSSYISSSLTTTKPSEKLLNEDINVASVMRRAKSSSSQSDNSSVDSRSMRDLDKRQHQAATPSMVSRVDVVPTTTKPLPLTYYIDNKQKQQQSNKDGDAMEIASSVADSVSMRSVSSATIQPTESTAKINKLEPSKSTSTTTTTSTTTQPKVLDDQHEEMSHYTSFGKPIPLAAPSVTEQHQPEEKRTTKGDLGAAGEKETTEKEDLNVAKGGKSYFLDLSTNKMLKSPTEDKGDYYRSSRISTRPYYSSGYTGGAYSTDYYGLSWDTDKPTSKRPLSSVGNRISSSSRQRFPRVESYNSGPYGSSKRTRSSLSPMATSPATKSTKYSIYGGFKKTPYDDRPSTHVPRLSYSRAIGPKKDEVKPKLQSRFLKLK